MQLRPPFSSALLGLTALCGLVSGGKPKSKLSLYGAPRHKLDPVLPILDIEEKYIRSQIDGDVTALGGAALQCSASNPCPGGSCCNDEGLSNASRLGTFSANITQDTAATAMSIARSLASLTATQRPLAVRIARTALSPARSTFAALTSVSAAPANFSAVTPPPLVRARRVRRALASAALSPPSRPHRVARAAVPHRAVSHTTRAGKSLYTCHDSESH